MRVVILHNEVSPDASAADADVLEQVRAVTSWLEALGCEVQSLPCTLDFDQVAAALRRICPDLIFNLVESLGGSDLRQHLAPALAYRLGIPCTGVSAESMYLTTHKVLAKIRLQHGGLPTPDWVGPGISPAVGGAGERYIIKAIGEHASLGMDDSAVVAGLDRPALEAEVARRSAQWGKPYFAEQFIDGREFNLSVLDGPHGPEVLPPAEIDFSAFPDDKPKIVNYEAKWDADSFEYAHTPRRFDFSAADRPLLEALTGLARDCWRHFCLSGYARVDFRVDSQGRPWVLEINSNCCISPDAGYVAALERAGISPEAAMQRIVNAALAKHARSQPCSSAPRGNARSPLSGTALAAGKVAFGVGVGGSRLDDGAPAASAVPLKGRRANEENSEGRGGER